MDESDREVREYCRENLLHIGSTGDIEGLRFLYEGGYPVYLSSLSYLLVNPSIHLISSIFSNYFGMNWLASCWIFIEHGDILISIECERERTGNGSGGHIEPMRPHGA
jgi:hypothetical protein